MSVETRSQEEAQKAVRAFSDFVNNMMHNPEDFIDAMQREHRTLQQCMTGVMLRWFEHLSKLEPGWYDLRNEASVEVSKKIMAAIGDTFYRRLPFI